MPAAFGALLSLIALSGVATPARAADAEINLATATCAIARQENPPVNPRNLAPAYAGRMAAKAGHARFSPEQVKTIGETLRRACEGAEAAERKATPKDYHFSLIVSERWYNSILDGMRRPRY